MIVTNPGYFLKSFLLYLKKRKYIRKYFTQDHHFAHAHFVDYLFPKPICKKLILYPLPAGNGKKWNDNCVPYLDIFLHLQPRTTDTQWRHKSKKSEILRRSGRQNMLWPYLKIWDWDLIFGRAVKAIFSPGVRSPCPELKRNKYAAIQQTSVGIQLKANT